MAYYFRKLRLKLFIVQVFVASVCIPAIEVLHSRHIGKASLE